MKFILCNEIELNFMYYKCTVNIKYIQAIYNVTLH